MPLYGTATIKHIECYDAEERSITVMVKLIWTPSLHEQARAILLDEEISLPAGEKSFSDYIYGLDLTQLLGSYRYIDNEGVPWFFSIRSADYSVGNVGTTEDRTNLFASGQAVLALYSEVSTASDAKEAVANSESARTSVTASQFSQLQSQRVEGMQIFGLSIARSEVLVSPITGQDEYVSVAAINLKAAHSAPESMAALYATLREVNSNQSYRGGLIEGMAAEGNSTRNDPEARRQGYVDGRGDVSDQVNQRRASSELQPASGTNSLSEPPSASQREEQSSSFNSQAVKDDF
jgi:hypothetical protein